MEAFEWLPIKHLFRTHICLMAKLSSLTNTFPLFCCSDAILESANRTGDNLKSSLSLSGELAENAVRFANTARVPAKSIDEIV